MATEIRRAPGLRRARARRHGRRETLLAALLLGLLALLAAMAPLVAWALGTSSDAVDLLGRLAPPGLAHPLGTDELGRDVLVRLLYGGRVSLLVGLAGALLAGGLGTAVGLVAGFLGGRTDALLMRLTDAVLALPMLPLLIVLGALDLGKLGIGGALASGPWASAVRVVVIVALFGWPMAARLVRARTLSVERESYVLAARALGAGPSAIMTRHVLPNVAAPAIVATTLAVGNVILAESVLSFLGLGVQPPLPSWGNMLTGAQDLVMTAPLLAVWPGLLIFVTVLGFNMLGDGLLGLLDPRARTRP
jgi:peptide/nickel transport system permease protein